MAAQQMRPILVVEDNDADFDAMVWAFQKAGVKAPLVRCPDGEHALRYLDDCTADQSGFPSVSPALVILDLNLPRLPGLQVLEHIRQSQILRGLPVVIMSTSESREDIELCYRSGANSYFVKPFDLARLCETIDVLARYWLNLASLPRLVPKPM